LVVDADAAEEVALARCHSVTIPYSVCDTCDTKSLSQNYPSIGNEHGG